MSAMALSTASVRKGRTTMVSCFMTCSQRVGVLRAAGSFIGIRRFPEVFALGVGLRAERERRPCFDGAITLDLALAGQSRFFFVADARKHAPEGKLFNEPLGTEVFRTLL